MRERYSDPIEMTSLNYPEKDGEGVTFVGVYGDTNIDAMADRARRTEGFKDREYYRGCIPCDRCGNCLELRKFSVGGIEKVTGLICMVGGYETTAWNTCNQARRPRRDRRKVVYDLENAPPGFKEGLAEKREVLEVGQGPEKMVAPVGNPAKGYVGGSEKYKRKGKERGSEGSAQMPKGLVN